MNRLTVCIMVAALCAGGAFAQKERETADRSKVTGADNSAVAEELKRIENDWVEAAKAKDEAKLSAILADNWMEQTWDGKSVDKSKAMAEMKEEGNTLDEIELGPMDVRVMGNVAVVTGSNTEKSMMEGKDTSGKYYWTDVFVKESGKWRAVASQSSKAPDQSSMESERSRTDMDQPDKDQPDKDQSDKDHR